MTKTLMLYTSITGNTEMMAKGLIDELNKQNIDHDIKLFDTYKVEAKDILNYDVIFIGVYTWAGGDVPLDTEDFYDDLYNMDLKGKVCGVFGSADTDYANYGTAVTMIYDQLEKLGATMIPDQIISNLEPTPEDLERCSKMVKIAFEKVNKAG